MRIIQKNEISIQKILKINIDMQPPLRKYTYCESCKTKDGELLFNLVTGEAVLLEGEESVGDMPMNIKPSDEEYLIAHRFIVNEANEDYRDVDRIREGIRLLDIIRYNGFYAYTILPTTDCNARCWYCFESGTPKLKMDSRTALDVAGYIIENNAKTNGRKVSISWFGGEPLYNSEAIDIICDRLEQAGVKYDSTMITNGFLFDEEMVKKATGLWKLKQVQITLDGTESVYNKTKAYQDFSGNAYEKVMENISRICAAGIKVSIRLNVGEHNVSDMETLADDLAVRFADEAEEGKLHAYTAILIQYNAPDHADRNAELIGKRRKLDNRLKSLGLARSVDKDEPEDGGDCRKPESSEAEEAAGINKSGMRIYACMADHPDSVVIMPDGRLHSCEHINSNHLWGSIYSGETKLDKCHPDEPDAGNTSPLKYWADYYAGDECHSCRLYPVCIRSIHCPDSSAAGCDYTIKDHLSDEVHGKMKLLSTCNTMCMR